MKNSNDKSEKELFDEEIKNWPLELEQEFQELIKKDNLIKEEKFPKFNSVEEADRYYQAVSWDEYKKEWLK